MLFHLSVLLRIEARMTGKRGQSWWKSKINHTFQLICSVMKMQLCKKKKKRRTCLFMRQPANRDETPGGQEESRNIAVNCVKAQTSLHNDEYIVTNYLYPSSQSDLFVAEMWKYLLRRPFLWILDIITELISLQLEFFCVFWNETRECCPQNWWRAFSTWQHVRKGRIMMESSN